MGKPILSHYYKQIVNSVDSCVMLVGPDGSIRMVNPAMERLSGYSREELEGSTCTILECDACELFRSESKHEWCLLFEIGFVNRKRCLFRRKDGSYASVIKSARLIRDEGGVVLGGLETFADASREDRIDSRIDELSRVAKGRTGFHGMVGKSGAMQRTYQIIERSAESDAPVAIYGESGVGKELAAHAIHKLGRRREGPFVQFNCAALNASLLESELFGHVKGAFTGAYRHRMGRFEAAHGGDLFLDEVGEIPLASQAKLLRVLETKHFERVGDHTPVRVDVRIITATNVDLSEQVSKGAFRKDLYFRINVLPIHLPPLRERTEDIPLLVDSFIKQLNVKSGKKISGVSSEVMALFVEYAWPGNVRELKSSLEYAFVIAESGLIECRHLPGNLTSTEQRFESGRQPSASGTEEMSAEEAELIDALVASKGNKTVAARLLGVHRMTVFNRIRKYGLHLKEGPMS